MTKNYTREEKKHIQSRKVLIFFSSNQRIVANFGISGPIYTQFFLFVRCDHAQNFVLFTAKTLN